MKLECLNLSMGPLWVIRLPPTLHRCAVSGLNVYSKLPVGVNENANVSAVL